MSGKSLPDRLTPVDDTAGRTVYYDDDRRTYHTWCADDDYEPVSAALIDAVSVVVDTDPLELESLSRCIDPDALNALIDSWRTGRSDSGDGSITFTFSECRVTVWADGELVIDPGHGRLTRA
ncbi:HalOD1 output domain-containing protein [Natrarchaeobius chitinivorans]|uniref:Halobacterial output domain-containing protein n=1 Tax=Natrarchaeobius chitinivorans TaxID=1679083 RepID=A0A3N6M6X8_NATCH|nr:HalOD1 output domain-containing protein [Natrarchaeobius chitinivorans]RQG97977.1 hypothetical protein EA473_01945 [Natrarchaeobius chitinivorans]